MKKDKKVKWWVRKKRGHDDGGSRNIMEDCINEGKTNINSGSNKIKKLQKEILSGQEKKMN